VDRPRANFALTPGARVPIARPKSASATDVEYHVTLDDVRRYLEGSLDLTNNSTSTAPPMTDEAALLYALLLT